MTILILDDANVASDLQRLKLAREAATLIKERKALADDTKAMLRALQIGKRLREIGMALGLKAPAAVAAPLTPSPVTEAFYPDEGRKTIAHRQKDNDAAIDLMRKIQAGEVAQVTDAERAILAKYSGNGGGLIGADGLTGSPHEYYTPKPVARAMWSMLEEMGFQGGSVLDPSAGTGIFTATRPKTAIMTQVELDETSGTINGLVNDGTTVSTTISPFEAVAAATPDEIYDAIITNVPFGDLAMRGDNPSKDKRFQKRNLQEYFILRSLQKLKPGGLAAFIVPPSIVSGKGAKASKLRLEASLMAEFMGAYRLPNKIFTESAAADTITDVIVFRKFSKENAQKIEELQAQNPAMLTQANVLWDEFLNGQYFMGEGKKYVLGTTERGMGKFGEVDKVVNDDSIANIAALLKRFPKSNIDWELLSATETAPLVYADGDVIHANGQTLVMKEGEWVAMDSGAADDRELTDIGTKVQKPLDAVNHGATLEQARRWLDYQGKIGQHLQIPSWLLAVNKALAPLATNEAPGWWDAIVAGMATMQLMQDADSVEPFDYKSAYPALSAQLAKVQAYGNKSLGKAPKLVKDALLSIRNARYKGEFTAFWLGEIRANPDVVALTPSQLYEKVKYQSEDEARYVPVEKLREAFSDFDPLISDEWCVSPDGEAVIHANDYYSGTYGDFLRRTKAELEAATDPAVRAKMVKQIDAAKERLNIVDVSQMTFSLFTPHVSMLQKLEFLKTYVSADIFLTTDKDGRDVFDIKQPSLSKWANEEEAANHKAMQRFVKGYLKNQSITSMSKSDDVESDPAKEAALLRRIKEVADKAKAQFDAWARANDEIQVSLNHKLNNPDALRFIEEPDGSPLDIPNLNTTTFRPHAYQYGAARRFARHFGGVLGFDVGLGKTLTALASTQYAQSIGVKRKTVFVVPNATLTNWKKEAGKAYLDTSDCLFVGVVKGKNGKDKVDNSQVKVDLNAIRENRHAKIFMTLEAFKTIPLRDETMEAYIQYLTENDDAYLLAEEDEKKKRANIAADAKAKGVKDTGEKSGAIPYFEDMGVDSLVLDEAHNYKNSKMTSSQFKGAKYLADPSKSQRGMDMQAKAWFVRGLTERNDGVVSLTATPVTNSPLEVYAMLTLAMGEREVNAMYGVTGADSFMSGACEIEEREEENIVGIARPVRVFSGLQNAGLLRRLLQTSCLIKTAEDVKADGIDISAPEADEIETSVDIGAESIAKIIAYKDEYMDAVEQLKVGVPVDAETKLTASPFNLIRKMTRVINDPELDKGTLTFKYPASAAAAVDKVIADFNKKNIVEERDYEDPNAAPADIRTKITKDTETGESVAKFMVTVRARRAANGNAIELLSTDFETQDALLKIMAANDMEPTVAISPKLAAVIANVKQECAAPRHMGQAKQIIFCDELSLHHKIRLALTQSVGIPASKIKIVNAASVDVAGMQDVQDGFNADGEDNKYTIVIANKKAEVGINLQKGCQAIHHMTIGWTPDSIHQRNGRGVRQGNPLETVNVYHYDADGTFDAYKRKLVGIKADWIGSLMAGDSSKITIEGDMTAEDYEMLAGAVGDTAAMARINDDIAARNRRQKRAANKVAQLQSLRIIEAQSKWLEKFGGGENDRAASTAFTAWIASKLGTANQTRAKISDLRERLGNTESQLMAARLQKQIAELEAKRAEQVSMLGGLSTDSSGTPTARSTYASEITPKEKETAAYLNWQKDVTVATRMQQEAAAGFRNRVEDGYAVVDLDAFTQGDAQIITGQLVAIGSFVEYQNKLLVAAKPRKKGDSLVGYNPADQSEVDLLRMSGATFIARGSDEWAGAVKRAIALDEFTVGSLNGGGFSVASPILYSTFVPDVRDGLTVAIPSQELAMDSFMFKAPYFPLALPKEASGTDLIGRIRTEQAALIKSYAYRGVVLHDMRSIGESGYSSKEVKVAAVKGYAIAHRLRLTARDLEELESFDLRGALDAEGLIPAFLAALPDGVAMVKSPEDLDAWALNWFNTQQEWLAVDSLDAALGYQIRTYRATANKIDDGKERWFKLMDSDSLAVQAEARVVLSKAFAEGYMADEIAAETDTYSSYLPSAFASANGRKIAELLFADTGDYIELKVGVAMARAAMQLNGRARIYVENWGDAVTLALKAINSMWPTMRSQAKAFKAKAAFDAAGVDIDGMLTALRKIPGVSSARIGINDDMKFPDKYSAQFKYEANQYILLALVRGSPTYDKVAKAGAAGLQGRTFDNVSKCFRVTVKEGEKFSDGKPVASVASLFAHLGLNISDYIV